MKKIAIFLLTFVVGALVLVGCDKKQDDTGNTESVPTITIPTGSTETSKVLSHATLFYNCVGGLAGDWAPNNSNKMKAVSIDDIAKLDKALGDTLKTKNIKYLYVMEDYELNGGLGWESNAYVDGATKAFNGGFTVKVIRSSFESVTDEDTGKVKEIWSANQWLPNPHDAHAESLTPATLYIPVWRETDTEGDGKGTWDQNPVAISGAGKYTVVLAEYATVSSATTPGYGMALVKTGDVELKKTEFEKMLDEYAALKAGTQTDKTTFELKGKVVAVQSAEDAENGGLKVSLILNVNDTLIGISNVQEADKEDATKTVNPKDVIGLEKDAEVSFKGTLDVSGGLKVGEANAEIKFDTAVCTWNRLPENASIYFVKGTMNGWGVSASGALLLNADKTEATVTIELAKDAEFKIANADWTKEFAFSALPAGTTDFADKGGNILVVNAGTYTFTVKGYNTETPTLEVVKK